MKVYHEKGGFIMHSYRKALIEAGKELLHSGLTVETWGNLSLRDPESGLIYLTPSAMDYDDCIEDDIVVLFPDGSISSGTRKPSIEKDLHLAIYRTRPEINAVIHTHPIYSTIFSCIGEPIPIFLDEAAQSLSAPVKVCPYALPGSKELAKICANALSHGENACLLKSHGTVCIGHTLKEVFTTTKALEMTAEIYWRIRAIGKMPDPLDPKDIAAMRHFALYHYGQQK